MGKWEKEIGKEKEKDFLSLRAGGGGGFRPTWARARLAAQLAQLCGGDGGDSAEVRAHQPGRGEGADGVGDNGGGEGLDRGSTGSGDPRRFSAVGPVLRWGGGGGAWVVDEDHRGGANFSCGGLGRPVRGMVAGVRGGEAAGEFFGRIRLGEVACRERGSVAELLALFN
jgi:hypothetical protein